MKRRIFLLSSCLLFSTSALAQSKGGPSSLPVTPASPESTADKDVKEVPIKRQIKSSVGAKTLKQGAPDRTKIATFESKASGPISIACKVLKDKKLDCKMGNDDTRFAVTLSRAPAKDTLILKYPAEHHLLVGSKSIHLYFPGVDGVWTGK